METPITKEQWQEMMEYLARPQLRRDPEILVGRETMDKMIANAKKHGRVQVNSTDYFDVMYKQIFDK